jgi:protein-S-isoprenylcysteine O-methyltransferase Ste14
MRPSPPSLRLLIMALVGTVLYTILPILGWGDVASFFAHPARTAVAVLSILAAVAASFAGISLSGGVREDRGNRWVLWLLGLISIGLGFLPAYMDRRDIWTLDGDAVRYLGLVLYAAGIAYRMAAVFVLGRRFSPVVAIQKDHDLVTDGMYGVTRHPSYLGLIVATLGMALVFRSSVGVLLTVLTFAVLVGRMDAEEALLVSEFGPAYEAYRQRTWRLVPHVY